MDTLPGELSDGVAEAEGVDVVTGAVAAVAEVRHTG